MQGLGRLVQAHGKALSSSVLQHVRVAGGVVSSFQVRQESGQPKKQAVLEDQGFESTTIADILKEKGQKADGSWLWCSVDDTVYDAVKSMTHNNVGALLVVKPGTERKLAGIITERDYLRKIIVQGRSSKTTKVGDIMTEENKLITVSPDTKVLRAMELMTNNRIRHIPVVEDKGMKGMVSIGDVVRAVVDEHREELQRLSSYIQGGY
jgi:CBS domain-containing protein